MVKWRNLGKRWASDLAAVLVATGLTLVGGCGKKEVKQGSTGPDPAAAAVAGENSKPTQAASSTNSYGSVQQSFAQATRDGDNPPIEEKPANMHLTGKPTYKFLEAVKQHWDAIHFADGAGKPIHYTALIETSFGTIVMDLKPDVAPNHVRNFIALARAGYYDQLRFDRIRHEEALEADSPSPLKLDAIEGGCPSGTGETVSGSIGYWLKPEFNDKEKHEAGTVGACRDAEVPDTAATRFYIVLDKTPFLDGKYTVFGKVKDSSLDVVRKIAQQPVLVDDGDRDNTHRPKDPVIIKKVTIQSSTGAES